MLPPKMCLMLAVVSQQLFASLSLENVRASTDSLGFSLPISVRAQAYCWQSIVLRRNRAAEACRGKSRFARRSYVRPEKQFISVSGASMNAVSETDPGCLSGPIEAFYVKPVQDGNVRICELYDITKPVPYQTALSWQKRLQAERIQHKLDGKNAVAKVGDYVSVHDDKYGDTFEVHRVQRGGKVTYHCPGQLVGYPIVDLTSHQQDIAWYLRQVESLLIDVLDHFGIKATTIEGLTGVWVDNAKIAAIGVGASRWVTMHGFALNVDPECSLQGFKRIIPCGIEDRPVCSMRSVLGDLCPSVEEVRRVTHELFATRFQVQMQRMDPNRFTQG